MRLLGERVTVPLLVEFAEDESDAVMVTFKVAQLSVFEPEEHMPILSFPTIEPVTVSIEPLMLVAAIPALECDEM